MPTGFVDGSAGIPITALGKDKLARWLAGQPQSVRAWVESVKFTAEPGEIALVAGANGRIARVLVGIGGAGDLWTYAGLPARLPRGRFRIEAELDARAATRATIGWSLGFYSFARYKPGKAMDARLVWPKGADRAAVERTVSAMTLVRDLVTTPAADMGPVELAAAARAVARRHGARCSIVVGDELLRRNFPLVHAVGRASTRAPRLIDLRWGSPSAPRVTLVGKGVCFDTGGLDIKSDAGMKLMKKDMGGAAHALALAGMVMAAKLPVRLRVLIPAVENSISGNAMRPLDVVRSRKGLSVEIGNTDAEGRLILADALTEADSEKPNLLIDFATLTGAARVALGPELPAMFSNDDTLAGDFLRHAEAEGDPLWRLPLWRPYRRLLDSKVADLNNISDGPFAGAITAALFLQEFVMPNTPWAHFDVYSWNSSARPGRPEGGEAQTLRAAFALIEERFRAKPRPRPAVLRANPVRRRPVPRTVRRTVPVRRRPR